MFLNITNKEFKIRFLNKKLLSQRFLFKLNKLNRLSDLCSILSVLFR